MGEEGEVKGRKIFKKNNTLTCKNYVIKTVYPILTTELETLNGPTFQMGVP